MVRCDGQPMGRRTAVASIFISISGSRKILDEAFDYIFYGNLSSSTNDEAIAGRESVVAREIQYFCFSFGGSS